MKSDTTISIHRKSVNRNLQQKKNTRNLLQLASGDEADKELKANRMEKIIKQIREYLPLAIFKGLIY